MSDTFRDLTSSLPLRPGCTAAQWGNSVLFSCQGACCAIVDLWPGEDPRVEVLWRHCDPARWKLVSDWHPPQ